MQQFTYLIVRFWSCSFKRKSLYLWSNSICMHVRDFTSYKFLKHSKMCEFSQKGKPKIIEPNISVFFHKSWYKTKNYTRKRKVVAFVYFKLHEKYLTIIHGLQIIWILLWNTEWESTETSECAFWDRSSIWSIKWLLYCAFNSLSGWITSFWT